MANCKQIKCCFLGTEGCPVCSECSSPSNIVDDNCTKCWNCEHDFNFIRGNPNIKKETDELLMIKR